MKLNQFFWGAQSNSSLRLRAVGDLNFSRQIGIAIQQRHDFTPLPPITEMLGKASLAFFNLECNPVSDAEKFHSSMIAPASFLQQVREEFSIANIANNHITDAGEDAFLETLEYLEKQKFTIIGGGKNVEEANRLKTQKIQGVEIGFLACADFVNAPHRRGNHAGTNKPGVSIYSPKRLLKQIAASRSKVDILVCSLHTGLEFHHYPDPKLMHDAHAMVDAGADVILVHHAHVRQGIEAYNDGLIAYGLGNFVFDIQGPYMQQGGVSTDIGLLLDIYLDKEGVAGYEFWLSRIHPEGKTEILSDTQAYEHLYKEQCVFNEKLSDTAFIHQEWKRVCRRYLRSRYYALAGAIKKKEILRFFHLIWDLRRRENRRWIVGLLER